MRVVVGRPYQCATYLSNAGCSPPVVTENLIWIGKQGTLWKVEEVTSKEPHSRLIGSRIQVPGDDGDPMLCNGFFGDEFK